MLNTQVASIAFWRKSILACFSVMASEFCDVKQEFVNKQTISAAVYNPSRKDVVLMTWTVQRRDGVHWRTSEIVS
jgi:hypothetical protein